VFKFEVQFGVRGSWFGVRGSGAENLELRTQNLELNPEPEHEPRRENSEE
jgi:hypothetical protein